VHLGSRGGHAQHDVLDGLRGTSVGLAQEHFAGHSTDDAEDGGTIVVEGAVAVEAVGPPPRRIVRVSVGASFLPGVLVHLVGLHDVIGQW
jgi:hypothetical protein